MKLQNTIELKTVIMSDQQITSFPSSNQRSTALILPPPCLHLSQFKSDHGTTAFNKLLDYISVKPLGRACIRVSFQCVACALHASRRLYLCVTCDDVLCDVHAPDHLHEIVIDVERAELFCRSCGDQVYDGDLDRTTVMSHMALGGLCGAPANSKKRRRVDFRPWTPDPALLGSLLNENKEDSKSLPVGLRGLNNLGNTCFMNSILQALLHTPPLRNYFLGDRHNRFVCEQKNVGRNDKRLCLACDTDALFSASFSGDRKPYSPAKFLFSWWQHAGNLASYEQQDAHEFFISMLDGIHEDEAPKYHNQD